MASPINPINIARNRWRHSLSAKLFIVTVLFILLVEAIILVPSVAKQYVDFLQARIETAYLVSLALEAPDSEMIEPETAEELFRTSNIAGVGITRDGAHHRILAPPHKGQTMPSEYIDLRGMSRPSTVFIAWRHFMSKDDALLGVKGAPGRNQDATVDIMVAKSALRQSLKGYALNILILSLIISTVTAAFIYWILDRMIVLPVKQLRRDMAAFESDPQFHASRQRVASRVDEIGDAERGLIALETRIRDLLEEQRRLAALGAGISKISHDLRNILASAQLMSDRLASSDDPRVRKLSPRLISSLDRAIHLSNETLSYGRVSPDNLSKSEFALRPLVEEVFEDNAAMSVSFFNDAPENLTIKADKTQLYRALFNLVKNSVDALSSEAITPEDQSPDTNKDAHIRVRTQDTPTAVTIEIEDNGPGIPQEERDHMFEPFKGSKKPGGTGLGAAIAHEIIRAHGGDLKLVSSDETGSLFRISLPRDQIKNKTAAKPVSKRFARSP